jgi:deoxyribodipyrimidine photo-lyase
MGLPLQFLVGNPSEAIVEIAQKHGATEIFLHSEAATEEEEDEQALEKMGFVLHRFYGQTLIHPGDLFPELGKLPKHFTAFRQKMESKWKVRPEIEPAVYQGPAWKIRPTALPQAEELMPEQKEFSKNEFYQGGEAAALGRLHYYLSGSGLASTYKITRNEMLGTDYSSRFSAWLANGSISPRRIYHELKAYEAQHGANESTYWLVFELLWRDFFRFSAMKAGASFFQMKRQIHLTHDTTLRKWCEGKSPHPFANACMNELRETGYLSNRGRQNAASFLMHNLKQPWQLGALYFEHHLIDYDMYSNYGNWTYLAGVGADPRKDRIFNLDRQAEIYDPAGEYISKWA